MPELKDILKEVEKLPQEVQDYFFTGKIDKEIEFLERDNDISVTKLIMELLLGYVRLEDFQETLARENNLDEKQSKNIFDKFNKKVFSKSGKYLFAAQEKAKENKKEVPEVKKMYIKNKTVNELVEEIVEKNEVVIEDENLKKRFNGLINSALRNVRTVNELKESLIKPAKIGGIDLNSEIADSIIYYVEDLVENIKKGIIVLKKEEIEVKEVIEEPVDKQIDVKDRQLSKPVSEKSSFVPSVLKVQQAMNESKKIRKFKIKQRENPLENGAWHTSKDIQSKEIVLKKPAVKLAEELKEKSVKKPVPLLVRKPRQTTQERPRVEDVKKPNRVYTPIEEIGSLDLKSFRRLSSDSFAACQVIKNKFDLLEEESYEKRSAAVEAWKKSRLFHLYLQIGQESFQKGSPVETVIYSKEKSNQKTLSLEEFNNISDLNQLLRM